MSGVEILSMTEIFDTPTYSIVLFTICLLLALTCLAWSVALTMYYGIHILSICLLVISIIFIIGAISFSNKFGSIPTGRYYYKCTIDSSVPFKDIYEKYNIIELDGELYILEDKEKDE